jgi:SOS-response transcriptional repressor LexA
MRPTDRPNSPSVRPVGAAEPTAGTLPQFRRAFPRRAADYVEQGLDLNTYLVKHKAASFFFNVAGDSMSAAGILDGDKVLVDRSVTPQHGHIVIAVIDAEYTLKHPISKPGCTMCSRISRSSRQSP